MCLSRASVTDELTMATSTPRSFQTRVACGTSDVVSCGRDHASGAGVQLGDVQQIERTKTGHGGADARHDASNRASAGLRSKQEEALTSSCSTWSLAKAISGLMTMVTLSTCLASAGT